MPSPALIVTLPFDRFPKKQASNVPNNIVRNLPFCSFASFVIVLLTPFISKPDYSRDLTIFMISFISLFEIINVVHFAKSKGCVADQNIFSWIGASAVDAAAVNPNGIKTLLGNFSVHFSLKKIHFLVTVLKVYLRIFLIILFYAIEFLIHLKSWRTICKRFTKLWNLCIS